MAAVVGEVYCFDAIVDNNDGENSDDIWTVRRCGYCGKEEKEGPAAASKNEDRGQTVQMRRADGDSMD